METKSAVGKRIPTERSRSSIKSLDDKSLRVGFAEGQAIMLAEYLKSGQHDRELMLEKEMGGEFAERADLLEKMKNILDRLKRKTITIISVTPDSGSLGNTVKVLVKLGDFDVGGCKVYFTSGTAGSHDGAITGSDPMAPGQTELSVLVPDFPGASGALQVTVSLNHLHTYTVPSPDIHTPPTHFSVVDATSNSVAFTWHPSAPFIDEFWANWETQTLQVQPGTSIELLWRVHNVTEITVTRAGNVGPDPAIHDVFPTVQGYVENWRTIGKLDGDTPREETYTLTVKNTWGTASSSVKVKLRQPPFIKILGAEVTQAIQHFTLASFVTLPGSFTLPAVAWNNTVGLIARKKTMVRVYVDSGMTNGFRNGAGPNEQANVVGKVTLTLGNGTTRTATSIRNAASMVVARPNNLIDRNKFMHALNIELPWDCLENQVKMDVRVWVKSDVDEIDHSGDLSCSGYAYDKSIGTFTFARKRHLRLIRILVQDDNLGLAAPSNADFWESVEGLLARYPIANDGVEVYLPLMTGDEIYETNCNLTTKDGWEDLLDDIEDVADEYQDNDEYWAAVVQNNNQYALNGISQSSWFLDFNPHPCLVARARLRSTFPHEIGHNLGFGHSDCGNPDGVDSDLPAHTDELGMDVRAGELIPKGYGDLMSYCNHYDRQKRWPTLTLWNKLLDKFAL